MKNSSLLRKSEMPADPAAFGLVFYFVVFLLFFSLALPLSPLSDDWYYVTAPNPDFQLFELLPGATFWRPFDVLFGAFMGFVPGLFPSLNRAVVIFAHIMNAVLTDAILRNMRIARGWRKFAVCYFLLSSAVWAVTLSPDALNQAYSVLFGLLAIYVHIQRGGYYYLIFCSMALLWKESGVSWFFVIPIFDAFLHEETWNGMWKNTKLLKRCIKEVVCSFIVIVIYFVIRFTLYGSVTLGSDEGTYKISLFSFSTIKNAVLLFASASSGVDSIALFANDRMLILAGITVILSLVFIWNWFLSVVQLVTRKVQLFPLFCITVCALGLAFPLMIMGAAGEMHAYPVLWAMTVLYAFCLDRAQISVKKMGVAILSIFLAFGIASAHKLVSIYDYSHRTQVLTKNLENYYEASSGPVLFVVIDDWKGYSVFDQSAVTGTSGGLSMRPNFDWQELDHFLYSAQSEEDANTYIRCYEDQYTSIFVIRDESAQKIK